MDAITETQRDFDSFSDGHQKTRAYVNVGTDANGVKFLMKPGQMNLSTDWVAVSQKLLQQATANQHKDHPRGSKKRRREAEEASSDRDSE